MPVATALVMGLRTGWMNARTARDERRQVVRCTYSRRLLWPFGVSITSHLIGLKISGYGSFLNVFPYHER